MSVLEQLGIKKNAKKNDAPKAKPANDALKQAIDDFSAHTGEINLYRVLSELKKLARAGGELVVPVDEKQESASRFGKEQLHIKAIKSKDGARWVVAFTGEAESQKGEKSRLARISIKSLFGYNYGAGMVGGLVINPWSQPVFLNKGMIATVLRAADQKLPGDSVMVQKKDAFQMRADCVVSLTDSGFRPLGDETEALFKAASGKLTDDLASLNGSVPAVVTLSYGLRSAMILHAVNDKPGKDALSGVWRTILDTAKQYDFHSLVIPAVKSVSPNVDNVSAAKEAIEKWMEKNAGYGLEIRICVKDPTEYPVWRKAFYHL